MFYGWSYGQKELFITTALKLVDRPGERFVLCKYEQVPKYYSFLHLSSSIYIRFFVSNFTISA